MVPRNSDPIRSSASPPGSRKLSTRGAESGQQRTTVVGSLVYFRTFQAVTPVCSCASLARRFCRPVRDAASSGSRAGIGPHLRRSRSPARFDVTR
jgi:hypothetical protein